MVTAMRWEFNVISELLTPYEAFKQSHTTKTVGTLGWLLFPLLSSVPLLFFLQSLWIDNIRL